MARFLPAIVLALVVFALPSAASARDPRSLPAGNARPDVLVWGGRLFTGTDAFADWLGRRHERYRAWARLHPDGRAILARAASPVRFRPAQFAPTRGPAPPPTPPPAAARPKSRSLTLLLGVLAIALLGLGALPVERVSRLQLPRAGVAALGIAILVGVAVARLAS